VAAGGTITYTLAYSNTGNSGATAVVLSDTVPVNTTFVSATGGGTLSSGVVTWSIGALAAGGSGSVQLVVRVNSPLANGTVITDGTYNIDSTETAPVNGSAITTTVTSAPVLAVSATDAPDPVAAGGTITYTLAYSNTGNSGATGVVLSDTIPVNTTFLSATGSGALSGGVVTWSIGALAAGGSGSVQLVVSVASPLASGTVITNASYSIDAVETALAIGASVSTTVSSIPTVTSVMETTTNSTIIVEPGVQDIQVTGTGFQQGAVLSLGSGITSGPTVLIDAMHLKATLTVDATAALGPRDVTVTNPDQLSGTLRKALKVVRTPDLNGNCMVDGIDLNVLARAWATTSADPGFSPQWDLTGDDVVDGNDLAVFVQYFGRKMPGCH